MAQRRVFIDTEAFRDAAGDGVGLEDLKSKPGCQSGTTSNPNDPISRVIATTVMAVSGKQFVAAFAEGPDLPCQRYFSSRSWAWQS
jgi:hypothetical protein